MPDSANGDAWHGHCPARPRRPCRQGGTGHGKASARLPFRGVVPHHECSGGRTGATARRRQRPRDERAGARLARPCRLPAGAQRLLLARHQYRSLGLPREPGAPRAHLRQLPSYAAPEPVGARHALQHARLGPVRDARFVLRSERDDVVAAHESNAGHQRIARALPRLGQPGRPGTSMGGIIAMAYRREMSPIVAGRSLDDQRELALGVLRQRPDGRWIWKMDPAYIQQRVKIGPPERPALWPALQRVTCPTLVVWGSDSDVLSEAQARRMVDTLANGELVTVPGVGHAPTLVEPAV